MVVKTENQETPLLTATEWFQCVIAVHAKTLPYVS